MKYAMTLFVIGSMLMLVAPVQAQEDVTLDLGLGSADTNTVCPVDVPDRTIAVAVPDVDVAERWIIVPDVDYEVQDGEIFIPGVFVERGGEVLVNIPPTIIPYDGPSVHIPGTSTSVGPFFVPTPDVSQDVEGVRVCVVLPA